GATEPRRLLSFVDPPQPLDASVVSVSRAQLRGFRAVARDPQVHVGRQELHRLEQHGQPLARFVAADEEDRRAVGGRRLRLGEATDFDAVEQQRALAAPRNARSVRSWADGSGAIGATEPFAAVGTERPRGVTPASGGGPSHGPSTRTSCPRLRNERAKPSTWPCTPPGTVRL